MKIFFLFFLLVLFSGFTLSDVFGAEVERGKGWGELTIQDVLSQEWLEGQQLTVTLTDEDMNKDSTVAEKILFGTAYDVIFEEHPTLDPAEFLYKKIGSIPYISTTNIELRYQTNAMFDSTVLNRIWNQGYVDEAVFFSNFEIPVNTGSTIFFENAIKYSEITQFATEPNIKHFINYDVSSLTQNLASGEITSITITLEDDYESVILVDSTSNFQNYFLIDNSKILEIKNNLHTDVNDNTLDLKITLEGVQPNTKYEPKTNLPFAFDVFRFGSTGLAESLDDFVLEYTFRLELEETGIDTGVFTGTIAYERITAKNIDTFDFSQLDTFGKDIIFPTFPDATDEGVRINYFDFGMDGVTTMVADQQELLSLAEIPDITITTDEDVPVSFPLGVDDITISYDNSPKHTLKGLLIQDGLEFTYTPRDDIFGTDEIELEIVEDMFGQARHSHLFNIIITITNVNDPPSATGAGVTTDEDTPVSITLSGNDIDGDSLTYSVVTNPTDGTLSGTAPNLSYSPNPDFHGTDSFTFKVNDGTVDSSIDTATITISPINDIPIANAGSDQSVNPSTSVTLDGSQSSDVDGDSITYSWIQTSGTPVTLSDSTIMNPQLSTPSSEDTLSFMLTVSDGTATSNPDVVNIYIGTPVPDPIPPPPPLALSTTSLDGSVNLSWQPPADDGGESITDYIIEFKKETDSTWQIHDDGTTPTTTTTISGLTNEENYQFRISSVSLAGIGDASSIISEIPVGFITEDVEPTVETTPEPTVETTPEPTVEPTIETQSTTIKEPLSFVDKSKDPQTYVQRYITEPSYKEWFDTNYSDYTIYEGIGITEDEYLVIVASLEQPVPESLETKEIEEPVVIDNVDLPVVTTPQENTEVKTETVIQDDEPSCGAGTEENSKGQCVPIKPSPTQKSGGGCLIATATYGSELSTEVQKLRELRDNSLLSTTSGTNFMDSFNQFYYSFSPIIADYERDNPVFKEMVKVTITPMISSLSILNYVDMDSENSVLGYGISLIVLNLAMYVGIPASVIIGIKKTRN